MRFMANSGSKAEQITRQLRRGRTLRRLAWGGAVGLIAVLLLGIVLLYIANGAPSWYAPTTGAATRSNEADSALNKLLTVRGWAEQRLVYESAKSHGRKPEAPEPENELTVAFTQDEVNGFLARWYNFASQQMSRDRLSDVYRDPQIQILADRLTVAGRVPQLGNRVVSLDVRPSVREGKLRLELLTVRTGNLPLPGVAWSKPRVRLVKSLAAMAEHHKGAARLDRGGGANNDAISAMLAWQGIDALANQPTENVLFLPVISTDAGLPVRLKSCELQDGMMILTTVPLEASQRQQLIEAIRKGR
jgi:hypothetical protein